MTYRVVAFLLLSTGIASTVNLGHFCSPVSRSLHLFIVHPPSGIFLLSFLPPLLLSPPHFFHLSPPLPLFFFFFPSRSAFAVSAKLEAGPFREPVLMRDGPEAPAWHQVFLAGESWGEGGVPCSWWQLQLDTTWSPRTVLSALSSGAKGCEAPHRSSTQRRPR